MPDAYVPVILAQDPAPAAPAAPGGGEAPSGGGLGSMLPMLLVMFLIFYVLLIRPQSKERKKREALVKNLAKGDKVVTTAGLHGRVVEMDDRRVRLEVDDGVRLWFDRVAVWQVTPKDAPASTEKDAPKS